MAVRRCRTAVPVSYTHLDVYKRQEQIAAMEEGRPVRRLSSFDFLTGIDDFSRMGAFRFKELKDGANSV